MTGMFVCVTFQYPSLEVLQSFNCSVSKTSTAMTDVTLMFVFLPSAYFNKWHNCKVRFLSVSGNVMPHPISKNTLHSLSLISPSKRLQYMAKTSDHGKNRNIVFSAKKKNRTRARDWGGKCEKCNERRKIIKSVYLLAIHWELIYTDSPCRIQSKMYRHV